MIIGIVIGLILSTDGKSGHENGLLTDNAIASEPPAELHTINDLNNAFISVSKEVLPAVVSIATSPFFVISSKIFLVTTSGSSNRRMSVWKHWVQGSYTTRTVIY